VIPLSRPLFVIVEAWKDAGSLRIAQNGLELSVVGPLLLEILIGALVSL
jgi:hypothetical protein